MLLLVAIFGAVWFWWFLQGRAEVEDIPPPEQYADTEAELDAFLARQDASNPEPLPEPSEIVAETSSDAGVPADIEAFTQRADQVASLSRKEETAPPPREERAVTTTSTERVEPPLFGEIPALEPLPPLKPLPPLDPFKPDS
jgi:hypothetical protein